MDSTAGSNASTPGRADGATLRLLDELKALAADVLGRGLERMFDGADDMLFEMARRASNNKDQRVYFDTMRVVRLGRPKIGKVFREQIVAGFDPARPEEAQAAHEISYENLTLQESRALEESIAVSSMTAKAEGLYATLLFELGRRFEWLVKARQAPLATDCLSPATISAAFRHSAEALDVEFDVELVIFKLFDRLVISELGELYTRALRFLDENGVKPAALVAGEGAAPGADGKAPAAAFAVGAAASAATAIPAAGVPATYAYPTPPMMDARTLEALRSMGGGGLSGMPGALSPVAAGGPLIPGPAYYTDAQLSRDLAVAAAGQVVPGWEQPRAYAYVQRAGAVGKMFNEMMQDPTLPAPLKPRFDQLRFAVIKSALADASFFADRKHPVRGLMSELTTLAASARASGMEALRRIEELVGQIQGQFDVAAEDVRSQSALPDPVDERTLEQFFAQQKEEARQRRQAIIDKTRRIVAEELQLQTLSRRPPDGFWPLLNSGWAPMMALRLLKQGADSDSWRAGMELLQRLLDTADPRKPASRAAEACAALANDLTDQLREIGMLDARIELLLGQWREAIAGIETRVLAAPAATPAASVFDEITFNIGENPDENAGGNADDGETAPPSSADQAIPVPDDAAADPLPAADDDAAAATPDAGTLLDLLMVLSSWFRVYDHDRSQNRWLKVVGHHPADGTVTFAEFNGQNRLQMRSQIFLDDLVAGRAEPIDLGPAARRALDAYLRARRGETAEAA